MKTKKTLVSVLIPTYNSAEFIKDCVESIINQTYKNIKIIIINDASTDKTFDILKRLAKQDKRIRLFQNRTNLGITDNMNNGIYKCNGKYIAILDGDDWAYPYRIEEQVKVMENKQNFLGPYGTTDGVADNSLA